MFLWIVLYFVVGFIATVSMVAWDIKDKEFNPDDDNNITWLLIYFAMWPVVLIGLSIVGFYKFIIFLAEALSKWIS